VTIGVDAPPSSPSWRRQVVVDAVTLVPLIAPLVVSAAAVAGVLALTGVASRLTWPFWIALAPILYLGWLIGYLLLSALVCRQMGRRFPKPRYASFTAIPTRGPKPDVGLLTALICYRRAAIIHTLPLVSLLDQAEILRRLVLRAHSPSLHLGARTTIWGQIHDPDITHLGDGVVVGAGAVISAHTLAPRPDGALVYTSEPVIVRNRATIGAQARVPLGCVIGEDAIIEAGAVLAPFTRVGAGEVWAGSPARFERRRDTEPDSTGSVHAAAEIDDVGRVIVEALRLPADAPIRELTPQNCGRWDSLGQLAIAAALFDRFGVRIDPAEAFGLRSVDDVAAKLASATKPADRNAIGWNEPLDEDELPLLDRQAATRALAARFQSADARGPRVRVVVAATFTAQPIAPTLTLWNRASGLETDCEFAPFDAIVPSLLDPAGAFAANRDGINVVLARPEDVVDRPGRLNEMLDAISRFASTLAPAGRLLVATLPPVVSASALLDRNEVDAERHRWRLGLESIDRVELVDFARVVERLGTVAAGNERGHVLTRAPYSADAYQELAIELARRIHAPRRTPVKVLALDCDNTLWGGAVGEVGLEGIVLSSDGPGRAFQLFQRYLRTLKDRGLLLVVVSRNEIGDVEDVFDEHPEMILRRDDIVAWRVNWNHKSQNLRELADELGLGLDAFVLLDDDPAVRAEVKARLPGVHTIPLPSDPAFYCETLERSWLFDRAATTAEDASRTQMIQEESGRQRERTRAATLEEYLAGLKLELDVFPGGRLEWPRLAQLTERTSQFNLSLKRRTGGELALLATRSIVLGLKARDRFGDYGLVGVAILEPTGRAECWNLETLAVSCRALGRGIEDAFVSLLARILSDHGAATLDAHYVAGPRNGQMRDFLARSNFIAAGDDRWSLSLDRAPRVPSHVSLTARSVSASRV
jgi:FkbH-like protein